MKTKTSIFWGFALIAVGVILCGNLFNLWDLEIFFEGWWTLFIIIPSICGLLKKEWLPSSFGLIIGILLFLSSRGYVEWKVVGQAFIPLFLIVIGLSLIFRPKRKQIKAKNDSQSEYLGIFSGSENVVKDKFTGANLIAVFGGVDLDLRKAKIEDGAVIDCVSVFGGIDIKLPNNVKVKSSGVPIFGGLDNKAIQEEGPTIEINYVCIFGGVDIK